MTKNQKLELTWIGKENRRHLDPRILLEDPAKSYAYPTIRTKVPQAVALLSIAGPGRELGAPLDTELSGPENDTASLAGMQP
jgi:hypothetical protein